MKPHSGQVPRRTQAQSLVSGSMHRLIMASIMDVVLVRRAEPADLPRIAAIYDDQVRTAISTFDTDAAADGLLGGPAGQYRAGRPPARRRVPRRSVVGYAYSSSYRPRPAYRRTREVSVYLDSSARGQGLGRALYDDLLAGCVADDMHQVLAVIALPNTGQRVAAPGLRLHGGRRTARGRVEVRPLDRHRDLGADSLNHLPPGLKDQDRVARGMARRPQTAAPLRGDG